MCPVSPTSPGDKDLSEHSGDNDCSAFDDDDSDNDDGNEDVLITSDTCIQSPDV